MKRLDDFFEANFCFLEEIFDLKIHCVICYGKTPFVREQIVRIIEILLILPSTNDFS